MLQNRINIPAGAATWTIGIATLLLSASMARAGAFDSGSDGSDGVLELTEPGTILFNPADFSPPLDQDGDGVYHFTSIHVAEGVEVLMKAVPMGVRPVIWLSQGDARIHGVLNLNGEDGHAGDRPSVRALGGAGGYEGGQGGQFGASATPGAGPGGGRVYNHGAGASHVSHGWQNNNIDRRYGNAYLMPLLGGSGGAGGTNTTGGGGGAGGGALLIASSTLIDVNGTISANGGNGGGISGAYYGGPGSGGAIRLMAPVVSGVGTLSTAGRGTVAGTHGSNGRIRIEAFNQQFAGTVNGAGSTRYATLGLVNLPESAPSVRVVSVGGVAVPPNPTGGFDPVDLEIAQDGSVAFTIEASNIPLGTVVNLLMVNETNGVVNFNSSPLAGTEEASTATASVAVPHGFSRFSVQASWDQ